MEAFVDKKLAQARAINPEEHESDVNLHILQGAVFRVLSRPNQDNMVSKIITPLRRELKRFNAYPKALNNIIDLSTKGLNSRSQSASSRSTYIVVLQNLMAELQPQMKTDKNIKALYEKIYKSQIKVPQEVSANLAQSMIPALSPSESARNLLQKHFPKQYPIKKSPWWKFW